MYVDDQESKMIIENEKIISQSTSDKKLIYR